MILGLALIESLVIYGLVIAFLLYKSAKRFLFLSGGLAVLVPLRYCRPSPSLAPLE